MRTSFTELAQHGSVIHCDVTMALNIGSTILPDLMMLHNLDKEKFIRSVCFLLFQYK